MCSNAVLTVTVAPYLASLLSQDTQYVVAFEQWRRYTRVLQVK